MSFIKKIYNNSMIVCALLCISFLIIAFPVLSYGQEGATPVTLRVNQVFTINSSISGLNDLFSYKLVSLEEANPMPEGSFNGVYSFAIENSNSKEIGPMIFSNVGIYRYEIKMDLPPAVLGYVYDTQTYLVTVYVKRTDQGLVSQVTIQKGDASKAEAIKFENTYTPLASKPELMVDPPVKKTVSGDPSIREMFTFSLTAHDKANPMPAGSVDGVKKITITGSGENDFGTWEYTREGIYYYTIKEVIGSSPRYTYDESIYTITDVVKDVDSQLALTRTVVNAWGKRVESCIFINKYNGKSGGSSGGGSGSRPVKPGGGNAGGLGSTAETTVTDESGVMGATDEKGAGDKNFGISGNGITGPKTGDETGYEFYQGMFWGSIIAVVGCISYLIFTDGSGKRKIDKI